MVQRSLDAAHQAEEVKANACLGGRDARPAEAEVISE